MPLNGTMVNREVGALVNNDLDGSMRLTLPLTFLILLLAFGTVVAGLVPIVLAITALIGAFGLMGIYSQLVEPISQYTSQVVVLIGLAVAIDYSLFLISRFRTERRAGRTRGRLPSRSPAARPAERCSSAASRWPSRWPGCC